jgi:hypothetical protein
MAHEKSITKAQNKPKGGNRATLHDNSGKGKGDKIGPRWGFKSFRAADAYAKKRSANYGKRMPVKGSQHKGPKGSGRN